LIEIIIVLGVIDGDLLFMGCSMLNREWGKIYMIGLFSCAWGFLLGMIGFGLGGCAWALLLGILALISGVKILVRALGPYFVKKELF